MEILSFTLKEIPEENSDSYYIADVYSSTSSTYWHHRFLELDEMSSDESIPEIHLLPLINY